MSSIIKGFLGHFPAQVHPPLSLPPPPQKKKKIHPKKHSLYWRKRNFVALLKININIIISKKFYYIFSNETLHFSPQAQKIYPKKISYTSGNENPEKKEKKAFRKRILRNEISKKASYVSGGNLQSPKNKQKVCFEELSCLV